MRCLTFRLSAMRSDILLASIMALNKPSPSPRRAGPRHSGLLINRRITKLAFSSTLSPVIKIVVFNDTFTVEH